MTTNTSSPDLETFGKRLEKLMEAGKKNGYWKDCWRPFVCDGSPLDCKVFLVGFNPATTGLAFKKFWNPSNRGFNKDCFLEEYKDLKKKKKIVGTRRNIECLAEQLQSSGVHLLETNIYAECCKSPTNLTCRSSVFLQFLLYEIRPTIVIVHGTESAKLFRAIIGICCEQKVNSFEKAVHYMADKELLLLEYRHFSRGVSCEQMHVLAEKIKNEISQKS